MLESILQFDTDLFLFLNEINSPFWDAIMYWISHKFFWIPFYGFLVFLLYKKYGLQKAIVLTLLILVTFALCNTLSVEAFKNVFHRLRPCHNEEISGLVHLVNDHCGGHGDLFLLTQPMYLGWQQSPPFFFPKKLNTFQS